MIRHSDTSHMYSASAYDEDMCLKPPLLLWLALLYLSRGILLPLCIAIGHFSGVNVDAMTVVRDYWSAVDLIPSAIAGPVFFAVCRRSAGASKPTRWIWKNGKVLVALAAVVDILVVMAPPLWNRTINDALVVSLIAASIDIYFLVYVLYVRRVRDSFLDFPPPLSKE